MTTQQWQQVDNHRSILQRLQACADQYETAVRELEALERYGVSDELQAEALANLELSRVECGATLRSLAAKMK